MGGDEGLPNSVELCGGTHVNRLGDIGFFKIIGEGSVAAGVRRIEALTGQAASDHIRIGEQILNGIAAELKVSLSVLPERMRSLIEDRKRLERELVEARRKLAAQGTSVSPEAKDVSGIRYIGRRVDGVSARDLKIMVDDLKTSGEGIYAIVAVNDGKASLVVGVTKTLEANFDAVELVRSGAKAVGGNGGGGRSDMAQAGGPDGGKADAALLAIEEEINSRAIA
tara:strand:+ start:17 stop:691 length:675 start_codon:yes stop_codon:yes gene_type:complete